MVKVFVSVIENKILIVKDLHIKALTLLVILFLIPECTIRKYRLLILNVLKFYLLVFSDLFKRDSRLKINKSS